MPFEAVKIMIYQKKFVHLREKFANLFCMEGAVKRVLFVNSEMSPYLKETSVADLALNLSQGIQEKKVEIRSFMPRYGLINERKNQLHEVIRLSGMNIVIGDVDRPLIIKVASLPAARMQVYFIDNEDYFRRKAVYTDANGNFFKDNAERAVFFARGVLETVKKLRWSPDVIHCTGWISQVLPLYLKKCYKDDPIFADSKVVLSLIDDTPASFDSKFQDILQFQGVSPQDVEVLQDPTGINLAKLAISYSDGVIEGAAGVPAQLAAYAKELSLPVLEYDAARMADGSYVDSYKSFYDQL